MREALSRATREGHEAPPQGSDTSQQAQRPCAPWRRHTGGAKGLAPAAGGVAPFGVLLRVGSRLMTPAGTLASGTGSPATSGWLSFSRTEGLCTRSSDMPPKMQQQQRWWLWQ